MTRNIWSQIQQNSIYDVSTENNKRQRNKDKMLDLLLNDYAKEAKIFMVLNGLKKKGFYESLKERHLLPYNTHHKSKKRQFIDYTYFCKLLNNDTRYPFETRRDLFEMIMEFSSARILELEKERQAERKEILRLSKSLGKKDLAEVEEIRDNLEKKRAKKFSDILA